jgi:hypothetical protein
MPIENASTVFVEPDASGRWTVRRAGERTTLSRHETATDADRAARALGGRVVLRDRYQRIHSVVGERVGAGTPG